jgi:hypothetical protein
MLKNRILEILQKPIMRARRHEADKVDQQGGRHRQHKVSRRPGRRDPHHVAARTTQRAKVHGNRLGVAKKERDTKQQEHGRQHDRPERIDVLQGIEADPAQPPGRIVAEPVCDKAVRRLVQRDGQDDRHDPGRGGVEHRGELLVHLTLLPLPCPSAHGVELPALAARRGASTKPGPNGR